MVKHQAIDLEVEAARQEAILEAIRAGLVQSAHDVSEGGVAVALAEKTFGSRRFRFRCNIRQDLQ